MSNNIESEMLLNGRQPIVTEKPEPKAPDWSDENVVKFRQLEHGEEIKKGDWVDASPNGYHDWPQWNLVTKSGGTAPDPACPAHRIYRRILWMNA